MKNRFFLGILGLAFLVVGCQNSSFLPSVPPSSGGGPPGAPIGEDTGGGGSGSSSQAAGTLTDCVTPFYNGMTPFRNPLTTSLLDPDSSGAGDFPGLTSMATAEFPEVGRVLMVLYQDGILIYDSLGRPLAKPLSFDGDCNVTGANFLWTPSTASDPPALDFIQDLNGVRGPLDFIVAYNDGAMGYWNFERGYVGDGDDGAVGDYFFTCAITESATAPGTAEGPRDFWINGGGDQIYCGGPSEWLCEATSSSFTPRPGGAGNIGLEWDAYGNLWQRSAATPTWPDAVDDFACETPGDENPDSRGTAIQPMFVVWERGLPRSRTSQAFGGDACPMEAPASQLPNQNVGQCNVHIFTSANTPSGPWGIATNINMGAVTDFDFTSDNRMVYTQGFQDYVGFTSPIPDHFDAHPFGNPVGAYDPPSPLEVQFVRGDFGTNAGADNIHFISPWGVSVDKVVTDMGVTNEVYVADFGNARIRVFDDQGNYLRDIHQSDIPSVAFQGPMDIAFDDFCRIFILDQRLASDGTETADILVLLRQNCPTPTAGSAEVRVLDSETGAPIEGAQVVLPLFSTTIIGFTDQQGRLTFPSVPPGQRSMTVTTQGYSSTTIGFSISSGETVFVEDSVGSGSISITPIGNAQFGGVSGTVRDEHTNFVIPNAIVTIAETGDFDITDSGGRFFITGIVAGAKTIDVSANNYLPNSKGVIIVDGLSFDVGDIILTPSPSN